MKIFDDGSRDRRPGEFLFVICSPKSYHRTAIAIEDAGYEIRDCIMYLYSMHDRVMYIPICVARKPLEGTVANNVIKYGCGGLNIDGTRVATSDNLNGGASYSAHAVYSAPGWKRPWMDDPGSQQRHMEICRAHVKHAERLGRWPANIIHDGSEIVINAFPHTKGGTGKPTHGGKWKENFFSIGRVIETATYDDSGSAARYFHCAPTLHDVVTYLRKMQKCPRYAR